MAARYKLIIDDESHLSRVGSWRIRWWAVALSMLIAIAALVGLSVIVIMNTPLKGMLPGYLPPQQRAATLDDIVRLDSLQYRYEINQAYLDNILNILNTDRIGGDSLKWASMTVTKSVDSLISASDRETKFRARLDERERYNLSILAPMAAEEMIFEEPAPGYTFGKGAEKERAATILIPVSQLVRNLADGIVADVHFNPAGGYSLIIQHSNGFMSRWSRLGLPVVNEGENVLAGQAIAPTAAGTGRDGAYVTLEMWRNGTQLLPSAILRGERKVVQKVEPLSQMGNQPNSGTE